MRHAKHMANLVAGRLQAPVHKYLLLRVPKSRLDLPRRHQLVHLLLMRCLQLRLSLVLAEKERPLILVLPIKRLKIVLREVIIRLALVNRLQHADRILILLVFLIEAMVLVGVIVVGGGVHHGGDGVADGGTGGARLRRRQHAPQRHFRAHHRALIKHIVGELVGCVILLLLHYAVHLFVGRCTARWISQMVMTGSNCLFVSFAPCRIQLNRVGFTTMSDNECLEVIIGVVLIVRCGGKVIVVGSSQLDASGRIDGPCRVHIMIDLYDLSFYFLW